MTGSEIEKQTGDITAPSEPNSKLFAIALTLLAFGLFALRLSTPSNLLDQDQERPGTYVLDVILNGHWMCQRDLTGDITSKPPLWTWISAVASLARGRVDRFTLWVPGAIGAWGTTMLVFLAGRKVFGAWAGFWAGIAGMVCTAGLKEFGLARTDGVFSLTVTACALAAYRAWVAGIASDDSVAAADGRRKTSSGKNRPRADKRKSKSGMTASSPQPSPLKEEREKRVAVHSPHAASIGGSRSPVVGGYIIRNRAWLLFWFCAGITTLTKGPLGVVLGAGGLLAAVWESRQNARRSLSGPHLAGLAIFLAIAGGWFLLAYREVGQALIDKMIGRELVGHVARADKTNFPGRFFYQPILYYLGRGAPWSLAALYSMWRVCKHPSGRDDRRRFERFLFCWFWLGLVIFSISPHQRGDLIWPIIPAGALLAGRQIEDWVGMIGTRLRFATGTVVICMLVGFGIYYARIQPRQAISRQTAQMMDLASRVESKTGEFPLTYLDAPLGLQIALNTWHPRVSFEDAAELLRGKEQVFLALKNVDALTKCRTTNDPAFYYLFDTRSTQKRSDIKIISNFPDSSVDSERGFALATGSFLFRGERVRSLRVAESRAEFVATGPMADVRVTNQSKNPAPMQVSIVRQNGQRSSRSRPEILLPGQIWDMRVP